jgi:beta-glucosidase
LLPFGHGLSYTQFAQSNLAARLVGGELEVALRVANIGKRAGKHVAQVYVSPVAGDWEAPKRLGAFAKLELAPGASADATVRVDPRLLATYDSVRRAWHVTAGDYLVTLATTARDAGQSVTVRLPERWLPVGAGAATPATPTSATRR